jgi:hypothetical protein
LADRFQVPPTEILDPQEDDLPILIDGEVQWERDWHMAYARVVLPDTVVHTASTKARALVEALKAVNHPTKDTWRILNGSIIFVDEVCRSLMSWGSKEDIPEPYEPRNDWMGRDIERMLGKNQTLDSKSMHDLQDAIGISAALKGASDEGPQSTVMAAVRAIEHVNTWTTGGADHWAYFASTYFKKAYSRVRFAVSIHNYTRAAIDHVPGPGRYPDLVDLRSNLLVFDWPHERFHSRGAADHISTLTKIYANHWLARGLGELETVLATPDAMYARLEEHGRRFDRQLGRLKRLRNSAIHGGPVSDAACASVASFAQNLGHQCLNQAMTGLLAGRDIASHITDYRDDHRDRYQRVQTTGDIDALFVEP